MKGEEETQVNPHTYVWCRKGSWEGKNNKIKGLDSWFVFLYYEYVCEKCSLSYKD